MTAPTHASLRAFLKAGAVASAPLAAAVPAVALAEGEHRARARRLQDEAEIRALHRAWLRRLATGQDASGLFVSPRAARLDADVRGLAADHAGAEERIEVAADGLSATGRFATLVELETELPRNGTFAQMAHLQGGGRARRTEPRTLHARYVKQGGGWAIARVRV